MACLDQGQEGGQGPLVPKAQEIESAVRQEEVLTELVRFIAAEFPNADFDNNLGGGKEKDELLANIKEFHSKFLYEAKITKNDGLPEAQQLRLEYSENSNQDNVTRHLSPDPSKLTFANMAVHEYNLDNNSMQMAFKFNGNYEDFEQDVFCNKLMRQFGEGCISVEVVDSRKGSWVGYIEIAFVHLQALIASIPVMCLTMSLVAAGAIHLICPRHNRRVKIAAIGTGLGSGLGYAIATGSATAATATATVAALPIIGLMGAGAVIFGACGYYFSE